MSYLYMTSFVSENPKLDLERAKECGRVIQGMVEQGLVTNIPWISSMRKAIDEELEAVEKDHEELLADLKEGRYEEVSGDIPNEVSDNKDEKMSVEGDVAVEVTREEGQ